MNTYCSTYSTCMCTHTFSWQAAAYSGLKGLHLQIWRGVLSALGRFQRTALHGTARMALLVAACQWQLHQHTFMSQRQGTAFPHQRHPPSHDVSAFQVCCVPPTCTHHPHHAMKARLCAFPCAAGTQGLVIVLGEVSQQLWAFHIWLWCCAGHGAPGGIAGVALSGECARAGALFSLCLQKSGRSLKLLPLIAHRQ